MPARSGSRAPLLAVACCLALLAAACENTSAKVDDTRPVRGGTLRVTVRDLSTLDPAKASGRGGEFVLSQIFDSLTAIDQNGTVVPAAASKWDTSADGLTWTFHLAPAKFQNGDDVTAYDFKFAFDRLTARSTGSDTAFQLEMISGFHAQKVDGTASGLSGVKVLDSYTLQITLDRSFAELPAFLSHPSLGPISRKLYNHDPAAFEKLPVGNGPFKLASERTATGAELVRNDAYSPAAPYLDGVSVRVEPGADTGWKQWLDGHTDVAEVPSSAIGAKAGTFGPEGFTPFWAAVYYGANLKLDKYKNPDFRRALSLAIDREAIAHDVYGGTKISASGLIPRGIPGYGGDRCTDCGHRPEDARALIKKVFGDSPPEVTIDHLDASPSREVASAIASNLRDVGLKVSLRAHTSDEYLRTLQAGKQELAELGWISAVPSADGFLAQQLRSGSPNNQTGFGDGRFDALIDQARASLDDNARADLYKQAESRALSLMPLIPIVFFRNHLAVTPRVHGFVLDGAGLFDASRAWLVKGA